MRRTGWLGMLLALLALACSDEGPAGVRQEIAAVRISPAQVTLQVGDTVAVTAAAVSETGASIETAALEWSVSAGDVASIEGQGRSVRLVGRRAGVVTLRAASGDVAGDALVQVENPAPELGTIAPMVMLAGSANATLTVRGSGFADGAVVLWQGMARPTTYVSDELLVAEIPASDLAEPRLVEVRVLNPLPGGGVSHRPQLLRVVTRAVAVVELSPAALALPAGDTARITARLRDAHGAELEDRSVAWSSSNAAVARVSDAGAVTAVAAGAAVITAGSEGVSASVAVAVSAGNAAPRITSMTPDNAPVGRIQFTIRGEGFARNAVTFALNRTQPTEWVSDRELRVLLWTEDSDSAQSFDVRVMNPAPGGGWSNALRFSITHALTSVRVSAERGTLFPGEQAQLTAAALDERGQPMPGNHTVSWRNINPHVATLDAAGVLTAVAPGQAVVEAEIGGRRGLVSLQVLPPVHWDLLYEAPVNGVTELWLARVDGSGERTRVLPGVRASDPAITLDGSRIAFVGTDATGNQDIYVVNRDGSNLRRLTTHTAVDDQPAWSPDGVLLTFRSRREGYSDIWVMHADGTNQQNLTGSNVLREYITSERPTFNAVGSRIVYSQGVAWNGPFHAGLIAIRLDGSDPRALTSVPGAIDREPAFSANDQRLVVRRTVGTLVDQLTLLDPATGEALPVIFPPGPGAMPAFTPDGSWLAFTARDLGTDAIFITRPNESIRRMIVPLGRNAVWARRR